MEYNWLFFMLSILIISLLISIFCTGNFIIVISLMFVYILIWAFFFWFYGLELIGFIFLIIYGGGFIVMYYITVQFTSMSRYSFFLKLYGNYLLLAIQFIILLSFIALNCVIYLNYLNTNLNNVRYNNAINLFSSLDLVHTFLSSSIIFLVITGLILFVTIYIVIVLLKSKY